MHEFDKCRFCAFHDPKSKRLDKCEHPDGCHCINRCLFHIDVSKVIAKAKLYKISVTDVLNLMREVEKNN